MVVSNLNFLTGLNALQHTASQNPSEFPSKLCEFIVSEFQLQSAILFKVSGSNKLIFQGKSSTAKKSFLPNALYECSVCKIHEQGNNQITFHTDANCEIQSTDFVIYESCVQISIGAEKFLLKVTQKTPFTTGDKDFLEQFGQFLVPHLQKMSGVTIESELSLSKIVAELANEFRTPTNSIIGFASLLHDDRLTSNQADYVLTIKDNAQKLLALLNDVIDFARVDGGSISETMSDVNMQNLLSEVLAQQSEKLKSSGFSFASSVSENFPASVQLDQQKLRLILLNFLSYLLYYSANGEVSCTAHVLDKKHVTISLVNKSASLPEKNVLPKGLDIAAQKQYNFTSLSFLLAKKYVELMQGKLESTSARERGTTIRFTLPINEVNHDIESKISALPKATDGKNKVLVIEDDYATSKLLSNYLNKWGYEPIIVDAGLKALEYLEREHVLAIITDIILPDINGLELLKKIRENKATKFIPIIVCSVEAEQQKAFLMGAVEYFVKPIKYKDLVEVLTSYKLKKDSNILCVDDDIPTLNLVKEAIASVGYNPIALHQSSKVIETIKDIQLDLAIVDLDMPEVNGFELIKLMKSNPKYTNLPIIIYTGKENFEEDLRKIDGMFTELLDKRSTNIEDLASTVNAMINRYDEPTPPEEAAKQTDVPKIL